MPLSCSCDSGEHDWYYMLPNDYSVMPERKRKKRCCSCRSFISTSEVVARFLCFREPRGHIEAQIYGDEVWLAPRYLCEHCADLYFSFVDLGFTCIAPDENMLELAKEYAVTYQTNKARGI